MRSAAILLLVVVLWAVGLLAFSARVDQSTPPADPAPADGVVALTGASNARITAAMKLLEDGKATRMLVSGVNPEASRADIKGVAKATRRYYDCCVDLGFQATDTVGNARETERWMQAKGFRSLIVVTSDYHMPRAMLELHAALPNAKLTPYPVKTEDLGFRTLVEKRGRGAADDHGILQVSGDPGPRSLPEPGPESPPTPRRGASA